MEARKQVGSSSSFTSDLFGSKDSSSSSAGIFSSIFPPLSKRSEGIWRKQDSAKEIWSSKHGASANISRSSEGETQSMLNTDTSFYYQEEKVQPCHLSSSIYYGGQEIYSHPKNSQSSGLQSSFKKDGGEDDGSVSRGNWWKGSLYY